MSKYVKLEEVIETVYQCRRAEANDEWIKRWLEPLNSLPTIDIVHCRECKYASDNKVYGCMLNHFNDNDYHRMYADDFCSYGERIDNE